MGGGRDKRKKQKGAGTAGKGADKTARKTERNETKAHRRTQKAAQVLQHCAARCKHPLCCAYAYMLTHAVMLVSKRAALLLVWHACTSAGVCRQAQAQ